MRRCMQTLLRNWTTRHYGRSLRFYTTENFPYTKELFKQNYLRYPAQSKLEVTHDYVFDERERLSTYQERIKEFRDPLDDTSVNVGKLFSLPKLSHFKSHIQKEIELNTGNREFELASKELKTKIDPNEVSRLKAKLMSFKNVYNIAKHYNIYKDLLEFRDFIPVVDLEVKYDNNQVYYGNKVDASITKSKPSIRIDDTLDYLRHTNETNMLQTLLFVNLDGNFKNSDNENLLWMLGNIVNGNFDGADEIVSYQQPMPMRGTGWHRCAFVLLEHKEKLDFGEYLKREFAIDSSSTDLCDRLLRDFKFLKFFLNYEKQGVTPIGLKFFQTEWNASVRNTFHNQFDVKEPVYEMPKEPRFIPKFEKYPANQPFNWYLDDYADKKDLNETVMTSYMKDIDPFRPYPEKSRYALLDIDRNMEPRWYKYESQSIIKREHQYSTIPYEYSREHKHEKTLDFIKNLPYQTKQVSSKSKETAKK